MVRSSEREKWAFPRVQRVHDGLREFAGSVNGLLNCTPANYANPSQNVFGSYGKENVKKMRGLAAKYDPDGVFQYLCPGGFKVSQVQG